VIPAMHFPSEEQWERADLVVFYLHVNEMSRDDPRDWDGSPKIEGRDDERVLRSIQTVGDASCRPVGNGRTSAQL